MKAGGLTKGSDRRRCLWPDGGGIFRIKPWKIKNPAFGRGFEGEFLLIRPVLP
jgi:hypothetical protein